MLFDVFHVAAGNIVRHRNKPELQLSGPKWPRGNRLLRNVFGVATVIAHQTPRTLLVFAADGNGNGNKPVDG